MRRARRGAGADGAPRHWFLTGSNSNFNSVLDRFQFRFQFGLGVNSNSVSIFVPVPIRFQFGFQAISILLVFQFCMTSVFVFLRLHRFPVLSVSLGVRFCVGFNGIGSNFWFRLQFGSFMKVGRKTIYANVILFSELFFPKCSLFQKIVVG